MIYRADRCLQVLQHLLHERHCWPVITCWVVFIGGHINGLDDAVVNQHREALAPGIPQHGHGTRVVKHQVKRFGKLTAWVTEEGDHRAIDTLVKRPTCHDGRIVHAEDDHIRDAFGLQLILFVQVSWHLRFGSGGRESARQTHQHHLFALAKLVERHLLWREALVEPNVWDGITNLDLE